MPVGSELIQPHKWTSLWGYRRGDQPETPNMVALRLIRVPQTTGLVRIKSVVGKKIKHRLDFRLALAFQKHRMHEEAGQTAPNTTVPIPSEVVAPETSLPSTVTVNYIKANALRKMSTPLLEH